MSLVELHDVLHSLSVVEEAESRRHLRAGMEANERDIRGNQHLNTISISLVLNVDQTVHVCVWLAIHVHSIIMGITNNQIIEGLK